MLLLEQVRLFFWTSVSSPRPRRLSFNACQSPLRDIRGARLQAGLRTLLPYYNVISGLEPGDKVLFCRRCVPPEIDQLEIPLLWLRGLPEALRWRCCWRQRRRNNRSTFLYQQFSIHDTVITLYWDSCTSSTHNIHHLIVFPQCFYIVKKKLNKLADSWVMVAEKRHCSKQKRKYKYKNIYICRQKSNLSKNKKKFLWTFIKYSLRHGKNRSISGVSFGKNNSW